jgi:malate dehydrogenase (oxaloacetate-decarboxylating)
MRTVKLNLKPEEILTNPILNKGMAFTDEERDSFGLHGFLPMHVSTIEEQVNRRYENFQATKNEIGKYVFLSALQNRNETLFFRLVYEHVAEMLPLIYTPTVGDASIQYSTLYREHRGLYLSYPLKDKIFQILENSPKSEVDVIVVTDGERILGLGDLGVGGMAIPVGKLALYTLFGGIHPARTLPIVLDVGTNNPELLKDPLYIGWRHERITGKEYDDFVDAFVNAVKRRYPKVLLQWEDFAKPHAKPLLDRYRDKICSFNDDIQGTASVALSAILTAVKFAKGSLKEQRIALLGGGSAGIGICNEILRAMMAEGLSEKEACDRFYVVDIKGLIHTHSEKMDEAQKKFAQNFEKISSWKVKNPAFITLLDVVANAHPTILIGVSTQTGAFTQDIVTEMARHVERPAIFPLSNPTTKSEACPEDLISWTKGNAIIATGSPFAPVSYNNKTYHIAQCNNVYIFPGVGLGVIASKATKVTDKMFLTAAKVLSQHSPLLKDPNGTLFPAFENLRSVMRTIGIAVAKAAQEDGVAEKTSDDQIAKMVDETMWFPEYPTYTR